MNIFDKAGIWFAGKVINLVKSIDKWKKKYGWVERPEKPLETFWLDRMGIAFAAQIQKFALWLTKNK